MGSKVPVKGIGPNLTSSVSTDAVASALFRMMAPPGLIAIAIAIVLSATIPLLIAVAPRAAINFTLHDSFIPIDAAWRALQGQRPHFDFYTPLGDAYFWLLGLAAWLWGMDARIIMWVNLLILPLVIPLGMLLSWRRLGSLAAVLLTMLLTALVASPTFIDGPATLIPQIANYNRIGWAFCILVCLWALDRPRRKTLFLDLLEAAAIGCLLFFLFYLKLTFFLYAVAVIGIGCLIKRGLWWPTALASGIFAAGLIMLEVFNPGLLSAYRADLARAAVANTVLIRPSTAVPAMEYNLSACVIAGLLAALAFWWQPGRRLAILGVLAALGGSVLLATQNFGGFAPPSVVLIMLLATWLSDGSARDNASTRPILLTLGACVIAVAALPFIATQAMGTVKHLRLALANDGFQVDGGMTQTFSTMRWWTNEFDRWRFPKNFTPEEARRWNLKPMPDAMSVVLEDGYRLINELGIHDARIENLAFSNPFPAGLRWPSPKGVAQWWDIDRTFVPARLTADQALGDAAIVMVPKVWQDLYITTSLLTVVQPKLDREFVPHESRYWTAWVRRPPQG